MEIGSKEIIRPPRFASSNGSTSSPPLSPQPVCLKEEGEDFLKKKVMEQDEEIRGLQSEVKKLRRCVKGVHLLGRQLQNSKEENRRLKTISCVNGNNGQKTTVPLQDDMSGGSPATEHKNTVGVDEVNLNSDEEKAKNKDTDYSSSEGSSSENYEDGDDEDEKEGEEVDDSDGDKEEGKGDEDDDDGMEGNIDSDEEETKQHSLKKRRRSKSKKKLAVMLDKDQQLAYYKARVSNLQTENRELRSAKELEETSEFHYVTSKEADELQRNASDNEETKRRSVCLGTEELGWEERYKEMESENRELNATLKEVKNVNHKWDDFWKGKKSEYETQLNEKEREILQKDEELSRKNEVILQKDEELSRQAEVLASKDEEIRKLREQQDSEHREHHTAISKMQRVLDRECRDKERLLKEKDDLLLLTKERIESAESVREQLRRDLTKEQQKCDRSQKLARTLLKQKTEMEEEIKRLNGTLTEISEEHSLLKSIDPKMSGGSMQLSVTEQTRERSSPPISPSHMKVMEKELLGEFPKVTEERHRRTAVEAQPLEDEKSLTKEELKEQVELFREQTEAYQSDFRRERRDREAVVSQLDSVKKELRELEARATLAGSKPPIHVHRIKDKPTLKDPKRHQLPEWYQMQHILSSEKPHHLDKRYNLIAHGHGTSRPKGPPQAKHRERERQYHQPRYFDDYREYEQDILGNEDNEQFEICRCPKHDCYVPAGIPKAGAY